MITCTANGLNDYKLEFDFGQSDYCYYNYNAGACNVMNIARN